MAGGGRVSGKVKESVFFGESVRYSVALDSGFEIIAHVPGSRSKLPEGAHVNLDWEPEQVWLLPGET